MAPSSAPWSSGGYGPSVMSWLTSSHHRWIHERAISGSSCPIRTFEVLRPDVLYHLRSFHPVSKEELTGKAQLERLPHTGHAVFRIAEQGTGLGLTLESLFEFSTVRGTPFAALARRGTPMEETVADRPRTRTNCRRVRRASGETCGVRLIGFPSTGR